MSATEADTPPPNHPLPNLREISAKLRFAVRIPIFSLIGNMSLMRNHGEVITSSRTFQMNIKWTHISQLFGVKYFPNGDFLWGYDGMFSKIFPIKHPILSP